MFNIFAWKMSEMINWISEMLVINFLTMHGCNVQKLNQGMRKCSQSKIQKICALCRDSNLKRGVEVPHSFVWIKLYNHVNLIR